MKTFCRGVNQTNSLWWNKFFKWNKLLVHCKHYFCWRIRKWYPSAKVLIKYCFLYTGSNPSGEVWIQRFFFCEISLPKWKPHFITSEKFLLQKYKNWFISVEIWIIRMFFLFMYRMKSFCRDVDKKNFLLWNGTFKMKTTSW